jgi:hypothetical protein
MSNSARSETGPGMVFFRQVTPNSVLHCS